MRFLGRVDDGASSRSVRASRLENLAGTVVLKSGTFEFDRTSQDVQGGVPTKVYVRTDAGLKFLRFEKISSDDRRYVRQELGLPEDVDADSSEKDFKRARLTAEKAEEELRRREVEE